MFLLIIFLDTFYAYLFSCIHFEMVTDFVTYNPWYGIFKSQEQFFTYNRYKMQKTRAIWSESGRNE